MNIYKFIITNLLVIFLLLSTNIEAQEVFILDERTLIKEANISNPTIERIKASFLSAQLTESEILEKFQSTLEGDISHFATNETAIAPYPLTSSINEFSLGIKKDFAYGVSMGIYGISSKEKYGNLGSEARNSIMGEVSIDLYKNFFGRTSRAEIKYANYETEVARIQSKIDNKIFILNLYKIYWEILLNEEAIRISKDLLAISKKQELDAKKRYKNGITDLGEVARQSSLVASKQTEIYHLENKRELYIRSLKELLPSIANKSVKITKYDADSKEIEVKKLIAMIEVSPSVPTEYTYYDDLIYYIEKSYYEQKIISNNYSDLDLQLYIQFEQSDNSHQLSDNIGRIDNYDEDKYQIGVKLSMPLGSEKNKTETIKKQLEKSSYIANKQNNLSKIEAYHSQTIANIKLLRKAYQSQTSSINNMQRSLASTKRKYNQARIPLRNLIDDQSLYLENQLKKLEIQSLVVNQLLDYVTIFTEMPYPFKQ